LAQYQAFHAKSVPIGFSYNSGENDQWIGVEEIREIIKEHVDANFQPYSLVEAA